MNAPLNKDARDFLDSIRDMHDPSEEDRRRVEKGLAATLGASTITAQATDTAATKVTTTSTAAKLAGSSLTMKLAIVALVGVGIAAFFVRDRAREMPNTAAVETRRKASSDVEPRPEIEVSTKLGTPVAAVAAGGGTDGASASASASATVAIEPPAEPPRRPRRASLERSRTEDSPASTLAREAQLMREAIVALRGGDATRALRLVDELAAEIPTGAMQIERGMLRIDALCALGRVEDAVRDAAELRGRSASALVERRLSASCVGQQN